MTLFFLLHLIYAETTVTHIKKCQNGDIIRMLRVEHQNSDNTYITIYTKSGVDKEIGRATFQASNTLFMDNVEANLIKAGWKCTDVTQSMSIIKVD